MKIFFSVITVVFFVIFCCPLITQQQNFNQPSLGGDVANANQSNLQAIHLECTLPDCAINGTKLERVVSQSLELLADDYKIRVNFLDTVLFVDSKPMDKGLYKKASQTIQGGLGQIVGSDSRASLKVVVYKSTTKQRISLRERVVFLGDDQWINNPNMRLRKQGLTYNPPPLPFIDGLAADIQYRGVRENVSVLPGKQIFQLLSIMDEKGRDVILGAFVIILQRNGNQDFYLVPKYLLEKITAQVPTQTASVK